MDKRVCVHCSSTGQHGAQFKLVMAKEIFDVHKFCGQKLVDGTPEGVEKPRLIHHLELAREKREEWKRKQTVEQERVAAFWKDKFVEAEANRQGRAARANKT